ncbi:hypothetical protein DES39_0050 [Orbus hercynius]|uniref:Alpha-2-macroglobulin n=1 Tax=Orbus hercynius TaxID=593135 RepID=A0A495RH39_9GAMM|nr:alpha-2-macroglobulin [Orbus hercynius]RKS86847.1 hypothetical protein DES39_0050 [Orbus hercynius]
MKCSINYLLLCCISLLLWGCDNTDKSVNSSTDNGEYSIIIESDNSPIDYSDSISSATPVSENGELVLDETLQKNYSNKPLSVLDSAEMIIDGASTLVITFSIPLDSKQDFNRLLRLVEEGKGDVDGHWELSSNGRELRHRYLAPSTKLTLSIDKSLTAINSKQLKMQYKKTLVTRHRSPMVGFTSNGSLLPSKSMTGLPITTLNVNQIDVNFFRIKSDQIHDFMQNYSSAKQLSVWDAESTLSYADLVYSARFELTPRLNIQENKIIDLGHIEALKAEGTYIAILNQSGKYNYSNPMTIFSISNIGIVVHEYEKGKLSAFAHRLDDGSALADITLTALCSKKDKQCSPVTVRTNQQGYAQLKLNANVQYRLVTASDGHQMSFVDIEHHALDLSEFNVLGAPFYQKQIFTFGPRDLYHPNEIVHLNALLRDADGQLLPEQPIKTQIISPTGQIIKDFVWKSVNANSGFYQTEFIIPANAATGKWLFKFNLGDDIYRYHYFSVEDFLPERMAITLKSESVRPILTSQNASFTVKGWYLYGAPASGNELQAIIATAQERQVPQLTDFQIGSVTEANLVRQINHIEQTLNSQGFANMTIDKQNWSDIKSPINITLQASILDVGGRPIIRKATQSVWPAERMPAIRPLFGQSQYYDWSLGQYVSAPVLGLGENANFEVAYVDQDGNKLAANKLIVRIVKERRDYYWSWSDSEGWQSKYDSKEFIVLDDNLKIAENGIGKVSFLPDDSGSYRIEVIDPKSALMSSVRFWSGYSWGDNADHRAEVRPDQVKLTLDKSSYRPGDTAKVHMDAPVSGSGYISLETNDGNLWMKKVNVGKGGIDVEIPIKNWGRHDIYVSAIVIRPSTDSTLETIKRAVGLLYLPMDTSDRQLAVTLDVPPKVNPEKVVKVKVKVSNNTIKDRQITVLLSAVDSGVLNITHFMTPDPYSAFLGRKRYNVEQFDVYGKLIEGAGSRVGIGFGGDSDNRYNNSMAVGGKKPLTIINIVAQQLKTITLNSRGEAEIDLAIPDFNGELRIMAQAWDKDRFGYAEKNITVSAPIVAELSTPSFLAGGDKTILAFELRNLTDLVQDISLTLHSQGPISILNKHVPTQVQLAPQEHKVMPITTEAHYGFGQGQINVEIGNIKLIDGQTYQLARSWNIGVRPPYSATSRISSAALNGGEGWSLSPSVLTDLIDNTVEAEIVLSHNLPFNLARYIKSLYDYQYNCLEQTISRLYPLLYVNEEQLAKLGINIGSDQQRRDMVQMKIDHLFGMQRTNGSFGLWSQENNEEYWLTVYATEFLLRAKEHGYQVNQQGLAKALERIEQYLYEPSAFYNLTGYYNPDAEDYIEFSTKAYAALILAQQKKITPAMRNELKRLYQQVKSNANGALLSPLPIMQLAIASKLTGNYRSTQDLFDIAISTPRDTQYYWLGDYGSVIRDKAQIYNLMTQYELATDMQADYLLDLSNSLKTELYLSTQELSTLFMVSWNSLPPQQQEVFSVLLNNKEKIKSNETIYRTLGPKELSAGISVHNPYNAAPLYVQFLLSGYTKKMPKPTASDGILTISRQYYDIQGKLITGSELKVGDLAIVMLDVSASRVINDAMVVDMIPAGLVLENPNLPNNSIDIHALPELRELVKQSSLTNIKHQEYLNDRYVAAVDINTNTAKDRYSAKIIYLARAVTAGEYIVPSPYVESMYKPAWNGVGNTIGVMTITGPN